MFGRNDDYVPNYLGIVSTTLNYLTHSLSQAGILDRAEILFTDWGSETPLSQVVNLTNKAKKHCKFIYVDRNTINNNCVKGNNIDFGVALNVAYRRSKGKYVFVTNSDTLIPPASIKIINEIIEGKNNIIPKSSYLSFSRFRIPWQFCLHNYSEKDIEKFITLSSGYLEEEHTRILSLSKGVGAFLVPSEIIQKMRGVREDMSNWGGHEVEFGLRVTKVLPWVEMSRLGAPVYHIDEPPTSKRRLLIKNAQKYSIQSDILVNNKNWGLGNHNFEVQKCSNENKQLLENPKKLDLKNVEKEIFSENIYKFFVKTSFHYFKQWKKLSKQEKIVNIIISWFSSNYYPKKYLDLGCGDGLNAFTVAAINPITEIYALDRWEEFENKPFHIAAMLRRKIGFKGYLRFINSDLDSGFSNLQKSFIGDFNFDLIKLDLSKQNKISGLAQHIFNILNKNGLFILFNCSNETIEQINQTITKRLDSLTLIKVNQLDTFMYFNSPSDEIVIEINLIKKYSHVRMVYYLLKFKLISIFKRFRDAKNILLK
jgi:SAM-dependent methyltransferase